MADDFIVFGAPDLHQEEIDEVVDSIKSRWLGTGPKVARFEKAFADYKKVNEKQLAALNSCTAALHVSMIAAGIKSGDEVITTAMTFCATINAIIHAGGTPVPVDIDPESYNLSPDEIEKNITPRTRAIVPVHFAGRPCDMDSIMDIASRYNLIVIEDCAHAIEAEYKGKKVGTFGDFGCFSFYVTKNITTGEGGMVIAKDEENTARIKTLALHGMSKDAWRRFSDFGYKHYQVIECGFKYNMMDIQAAIGIHQLARIEESALQRQSIWNHYQEAFADLPLILPAAPEADTRHAYHLFTIMIDQERCDISRDAFLDYMNTQNIGTGVHYLSVAEHPYYQHRFGWRPDDYPVAMRTGRQTVSLPLSGQLKDQDISRIINAVRRIIKPI